MDLSNLYMYRKKLCKDDEINRRISDIKNVEGSVESRYFM